MIQPLQTNLIISRFTGQEQLPVVKESRGLSSLLFFMSLRTFKGSQAVSAHNLFLFFYCFDGILCFPRQELVHSGVEMDKSGRPTFDIEVRLLCSLQAHTTLNKWQIREAGSQMRGSCACALNFHMGLRRQKGQLVHSSLLCCVLGFPAPQGQIISAV